MKREHYFYLTAAVAVLILGLGAYVFTNLDFQDYKYKVTKNGVEFVSNEGEPADMLTSLKSYSTFMVSPEFVEQGPENSYMATSVTLFSTVLTAKHKNPIIVARVTESGLLKTCQSNLGDVKTNKELTVQECEQLISDTTSARVFVELPDTKLKSPRVVLENGVARIYPSSYESVSGVSFEVLQALYPDAQQIIDKVNGAVGNV